MDALKRSYYELLFERDFLKKNGTEFQDFFSEIMEKRYPGDFVRVRPWGAAGDRKNDGYLTSKRTLFQVYAPNEMSAVTTCSKIEKDFRGALPYWRKYFDVWVFVHNSRQGLPPNVLQELLDLGAEFRGQIAVKCWGHEELKSEVLSLSDESITSLLGPAPTSDDLTEVGFEDLKVVLDAVSWADAVRDTEIRPVPQDKIEANALGPDVDTLLKAGMRKAPRVERFLAMWHDPTLGDRMAAAFTAEYRRLKDRRLSPDAVFCGLQEFAGGFRRSSPRQEAAILALLAYLFERCNVFEASREGEAKP